MMGAGGGTGLPPSTPAPPARVLTPCLCSTPHMRGDTGLNLWATPAPSLGMPEMGWAGVGCSGGPCRPLLQSSWGWGHPVLRCRELLASGLPMQGPLLTTCVLDL